MDGGSLSLHVLWLRKKSVHVLSVQSKQRLVNVWLVLLLSRVSGASVAAMLDSFGIELGVLMPGGKILCVSQLSAQKPVVVEKDSGDEKRYYLIQQQTRRPAQNQDEAEAADREILKAAGIDATGRVILKLLPPELEAELWHLEAGLAQGHNKSVQASFFRVVAEDSKYRFEIYHQVF